MPARPAKDLTVANVGCSVYTGQWANKQHVYWSVWWWSTGFSLYQLPYCTLVRWLWLSRKFTPWIMCPKSLVDQVWHWWIWHLPRSGLLIWYHKELVALCITWLATSLYQTWPEVEVSRYSDACYGVVASTTYLLLGLGMQYSETAADQLCVLPDSDLFTFSQDILSVFSSQSIMQC